MTEEELKQFKELLGKARQLMPADVFYVEEKEGSLILTGEATVTVTGSYTTYSLIEGEVKEVNSGSIY